MDALCIDQEHLDEKKPSSTYMGQIYERAERVIVSLAEHNPNTRFLQERLRKDRAPGTRVESSWWPWYYNIKEGPLGVDHLLKIARAIAGLGYRAYWTRVWIMQELFVAREVVLICGSDVLDWNSICSLWEFLPKLIRDDAEIGHSVAAVSFNDEMQSNPISMVLDRLLSMSSSYRKSLSLMRILDFRGQDCSNPLDHIYGFLHLMQNQINYKGDKFGPIIPDYRTSSYDLAMDCLDRLAYDHSLVGLWARPTLAALRIGSKHLNIQAMVAERRTDSSSPSVPDELSQADVQVLIRSTTDERGNQCTPRYTIHTGQEINCLEICTSSTGELTGNLRLKDELDLEETHMARYQSF